MILAGLTLPRSSGVSEITNVPLSPHCIHSFSILDYSLVYYFSLWFTLVVLSTLYMFIYRLDYVAWPRLLPLTEAIHYRGPGFRSGYHGTGFGIRTRPLILRAVGPCGYSQDVPDYDFYHVRYPIF